LVLTGVFVMGVLEGCGGGGGGGTFTTSVPGDKPLGGLTGAEADQLCRDQNKFISESTYQMDMCRISAYLAAAFTATLSTTATDAELRTSCSDTYTQCLNPDPDGGAGAGGTCGAPPPSCTATVAELAACLNDEVAQYHALARQIPECGSLTRAGLVETDGGSTPGLTELPASCQTVQSKCGGPSDAATAFAAQYCALVDPCCAAAGLGSQCAGVVGGAAFSGPFDETAAAACLDALRSGAWVSGNVLFRACGTRYGGRIFELRHDYGYVIERRSVQVPGDRPFRRVVGDFLKRQEPFLGRQPAVAFHPVQDGGHLRGAFVD
jgi:hypothetical protein